VRSPGVRLSGGRFKYQLSPGYIYTFTTLTSAGRGTAVSPHSAPMPLPYTASPDASNEPSYLGAQDGAFEYLRGGSVFEQTAAGPPIFWQNQVSTRFPYAVVGGAGWHDYTVSASVRFTARGQGAGLLARFEHQKANGVAERFAAYQFVVSSSGAWQLLTDRSKASPKIMKAGRVAAPGAGRWTVLELSVHGTQVIASVNGKAVASVADPTYSFGDAGISTSGWYPVQFRGLTVTK
jgi:hypothetical protein